MQFFDNFSFDIAISLEEWNGQFYDYYADLKINSHAHTYIRTNTLPKRNRDKLRDERFGD